MKERGERAWSSTAARLQKFFRRRDGSGAARRRARARGVAPTARLVEHENQRPRTCRALGTHTPRSLRASRAIARPRPDRSQMLEVPEGEKVRDVEGRERQQAVARARRARRGARDMAAATISSRCSAAAREKHPYPPGLEDVCVRRSQARRPNRRPRCPRRRAVGLTLSSQYCARSDVVGVAQANWADAVNCPCVRPTTRTVPQPPSAPPITPPPRRRRSRHRQTDARRSSSGAPEVRRRRQDRAPRIRRYAALGRPGDAAGAADVRCAPGQPSSFVGQKGALLQLRAAPLVRHTGCSSDELGLCRRGARPAPAPPPLRHGHCATRSLRRCLGGDLPPSCGSRCALGG